MSENRPGLAMTDEHIAIARGLARHVHDTLDDHDQPALFIALRLRPLARTQMQQPPV